MPITSILELTLKPEAVSSAAAVITETLKATRAFDGCLSVDVLIDSADETHIAIVELWESIEADDAYRAWRATPDGASELGTITTGLALHRYELAEGV